MARGIRNDCARAKNRLRALCLEEVVILAGKDLAKIKTAGAKGELPVAVALDKMLG